MLDLKSYVYGALSHMYDDAVTYRRDRNFYNFYHADDALGWLSEEEVKWILEQMGVKGLKTSDDIVKALNDMYEVKE